ncbi:hypothetical protein [Rubritalea tangerina]|uniref:Uncharacterized protein n=1 Tax=Rubritalea tangerina TaxID=430798 RepID=A0ABW4Z8T5_9BACT
MTRSELNKVIKRVGGMAQLLDMLTQITRTQDNQLVQSLTAPLHEPNTVYDFFSDIPGRPDAAYYLECVDESTSPVEGDIPLATYDILHLTYGFYAGDSAGEGYIFPFIKCADNRYHLIKMKEYPWLVH